jgi:ABC-type transport system involved in multi-copper enzyme maturation permease subunit
MRTTALLNDLKLVILISRDVCRSSLKERMMYGFLLLALLFILMANVPFSINDPKLFEGQSAKISAIQIGFVSVNIFTILIAIFVSINTLQTFFSKERLVLLLSKPVRRWQILEGVILGLFEMVFLNWFLMTAGIWLVIVSQARVLGVSIWIGMSPTILMALLYVTLVVFFYCLIPNAMAGILAVLVIIAGFGVPLAEEAFARSASPVLVRTVFQWSLKVLPQINALWGISMQQLGLFHLKIRGFSIVGQTFILIAALNLLACVKFRRLSKF